MTRELTTRDFDQEIMQGNAPAMIDFYADWCGPCKSMAKTVEQMSIDYTGRAKVAKVNVDRNPELAQRFGVMSIPTFALIKNGRVVHQVLGAQPRANLDELMSRTINA